MPQGMKGCIIELGFGQRGLWSYGRFRFLIEASGRGLQGLWIMSWIWQLPSVSLDIPIDVHVFAGEMFSDSILVY